MACMRYQPELNMIGCGSCYQLRMPRRNILVIPAMNYDSTGTLECSTASSDWAAAD